MTTRSARSTARQKAAPKLKPFTVDHFRKYANLMVLDNGDYWVPQSFQLEVVDEFFQGAEEVWLVIPEGNGKTTLMAGFELYHGDYTPSAKVVVGASSRDQCKILHDQAAGIVRRSPGFNRRFKVQDGFRRIKCLGTHGEIQVYAADERTGDGVIPSLALLDELHRHRSLGLYRTWRGKLAKRGGQLGAISTAGEPDTEFEDIRQSLLIGADNLMREGAHTRAATGRMVLHDYSVPEGLDLEDMDVVKAANPLDAITTEMLQAKRDSPTETLSHWRRYVCNQAVRAEESSITEHEWHSLYTDERIPAGESVAVGIDLGWRHDTTALVPLLFRSEQSRLIGTPRILVPPQDGTSLNPALVEAALREMHAVTPISMVVIDPAAGGEQLAAWIEKELGIEVITHSQSTGLMSLAYQRLMTAIRQGWIEHPGDEDLTRHVLNAVDNIARDGSIRFDRPSQSRAASKQRRRVIDALVALAMVNSISEALPRMRRRSRKSVIL